MPTTIDTDIFEYGNLVSVHDDWNASAADKRTSFENELREDEAFMASAGVDWWGAISQTGFGPDEVTPFTSGNKVAQYEGNEVIVDIDAADIDELRSEAGMPAGGFVSKRRKGEGSGMYRDFMQAASLMTPELDDLFTSEGYSWDNLSEAEMTDKAAEMGAWWN